MTISEQLQFSVLSAPIAAADRRALSQAWYSALYRTKGREASSALPSLPNYGRTGFATRPAEKRSKAASFAALARAGRSQPPALAQALGERRAPHLRLARQIEMVVRTRESQRAAATFVLDGTRARVRVLVVASGASVRVIAICSKRVQNVVARALSQARYASAARGIVVHASMREDARC